MKAALDGLDGDGDLAGRHVVVSGVGKVGTALVRHLVENRARVSVADVDPAAVARVTADFGVTAVAVADAHSVVCDIFSPCGLGAVLSERTVKELGCRAVVGSANNQLATDADGARIADRGILYVPDFIVNAGGVINIAEELVGYNRERAYAGVRGIYATTKLVLAMAAEHRTTTAAAAEALARRRMADVGGAARIRTFRPPARRVR
jgi:glutamate dehydrogenase/leucine dehydrogenase